MSGVEILAVAGLAGTAMSAFQQVQAGRAQAQAQRVQADVTRVNAAEQRQAGHNEIVSAEAEAAQVQEDGRRRRAMLANQLAGSGVETGGSADNLLADLAAGSALDAAIARWRGAQASASRYRSARMTDYEATVQQQQSRQTSPAAWWRGGSTLLTGGSRLLATRR